MIKKIAVCPKCKNKVTVEGEPGQNIRVKCEKCGKKGKVTFSQEDILEQLNLTELDFYAVNEPYTYIKILKDEESLDKYYKVIEPNLSDEDKKSLNFIQNELLSSIDVRLDEIEKSQLHSFLSDFIEKIIKDHDLSIEDTLKKKILYYVQRDFINYGKIDSLMRDPNIEDISCDGSNVPVFLYHRKYGSLKSNIKFEDEEELSAFVVLLAQKCGKHISLAEPILDATMPDGSRIQMTLSKAVTAHGSTFTIRKFRADPITPTDLIDYKTMSAEMVAYMWLAVENGTNALIAGGTAAGKTSTLNAISLFIPRESKIVSIEETREINLPHPNWIPGIVRSGFGEVVNDKLVGEIDLFDLMKAALRQRPEYILVGEIRGKEAYVLFQAMATGHTTYSTFHADSTKSLIHRLEGKPIEIPRIMLQALELVTIQVSAQVGNNRVRRVKQIVEIVDIDSVTKEILTNEVFRWDPVEDRFIYSGKSYLLEKIRTQYDMSKEDMMKELKNRVEILDWMKKNDIRVFRDVARIVSYYSENPNELMNDIHSGKNISKSESEETKKIVEKEDKQISTKENTQNAKIEYVSKENKIPKPKIKKKRRIAFRRGKNNSK